MKKTFLAGLCALLAVAGTAQAQTTAFTYQGRLNSGAAVANGNYDLTFALFSVSSGSGQVGGTITNSPVAVSNGLFTVTLDFATNFPGADRWLEIGVRTNGVGSFATLAPRQLLTSTPYAIRALLAGTATTANSVAAGAVNNTAIASGAVDSAKIADGSIATGDLSPAVLSNTFWRLPGNAGTLPGVNFLGTTDNQPLEFKVNGARAWRLEPNATSPNVLGGFSGNVISNGFVGAVVAGGGQLNNSNRVGGSFSTVGGGYNNAAYFGSAVVAGGDNNRAAQDRATVSGGFSNRATGLLSTVGGGDINLASGQAATVPGGSLNDATASYTFAAGRRAKATNQGAFVWADSQNTDFASTANNQFLIRAAGGVGIGTTNPTAALDVVGTARATTFAGNGGGLTNLNATTLGGVSVSNFWQLGGNAGTVAGTHFLGTTDSVPLELRANSYTVMRFSYASDLSSPNIVGGLSENSIDPGYQGSVIAGGGGIGNPNRISANASAIGGGSGNLIFSGESVIAGGSGNEIGTNSPHSAIGGGHDNTNAASRATIAGGLGNHIGGGYSFYNAIGGGRENNIESNSIAATIAGGQWNEIGGNSFWNTIGGGYDNSIATNSRYATIAGGGQNDIGVNSDSSAIGGGYYNNIGSNALYAVIPGGYGNQVGAGAHFSFAAGHFAKANHRGTFVWADSVVAYFDSTASNQFLIRASGGVGIGLTNPAAQLEVSSGGGDSFPQVRINQTNAADYARLRFTVGGDYSKRWDVGCITNRFVIYSGQFNQEMLVVDNTGLTVRGTFVSTSDRNEKENFAPVQPREVLEKVVALPLSKWNYKQDTNARHIGPMAQDFYAAFGVGPDDKHISTVDADGVALAAIQGLNEKVEAGSQQLETRSRKLEDRLQQKETEITELKQTVNELKQLVQAMDHKLTGRAK